MSSLMQNLYGSVVVQFSAFVMFMENEIVNQTGYEWGMFFERAFDDKKLEFGNLS